MKSPGRLKSNLGALLVCVFLIGMGEELWSKFIPPYLLALGGTAWMAAAYGTLRDFLDAVYSYPGGWIHDRLGGRRALFLFTGLSMAGYLIYWASPNGWVFLIGACFALAWTSFSLPAMFDIVAENLPSAWRSWGFSLQAILKRVPLVAGPVLGGWLIARAGLRDGFRWGLGASLLLALASLWVLKRYYREEKKPKADGQTLTGLWRRMKVDLKSLLAADCLIRLAEGIPDVFVVLYVMGPLGHSALEFGWLMALQMATSILLYLPVARWTRGLNRKPWVLLTFCFFALYPVAVVWAPNGFWLAAAFVIGGAREIGEPSRKAMIADLAGAAARGRVVGLYYLVRGLAVFPASLLGGWLWVRDPKWPFEAAFGFGILGFLFFLWRGRDLKTLQ
ncbi:MAG TPA: MFS transporter [bacterium]|nr:MFS transporter [bacterium]